MTPITLSAALVSCALLSMTLPAARFADAAEPAVSEQAATRSYATPDEAVAALVDALRANNVQDLHAVLGPGSEKLLNSGDKVADNSARQKFLAAYDEHHALVDAGQDRKTVQVGKDDWPLPIPLVAANGKWHFDGPAGAQEIVDRRIGRNEIAAIRTCLTYVDAQKVFSQIAGESGQAEYAQHLISSPGSHDGIYWPPMEGEPGSPLEPLVAQAREEGYPVDAGATTPRPYQGYYFRILKGQGSDAPGGERSYVSNGHMTGGFAMIAWPATYNSSGIMTFIVNQDGIVFQKDLGPRTTTIAAPTTEYDPDLSWSRVEVVN
jgi:hypothetical protein